jgi:hypothetical protein
MRTANGGIRLLFVLVTFLAYTRDIHAASPYWNEYCDEYCQGSVKVHDCTFADEGFGTAINAGSVCDFWGECVYGGVSCYPDTEIAPESYASVCAGWADAAGSHGLEWYVMDSCSGGDGTAEGTFYCSHPDGECVE